MRASTGKLVFGATVVAFLCLTLWPTWSTRCPPMQDYPQALFHAHVLDVRGDPAFDYDHYYECRLRPVYAAFYLTTLLFAQLFPIETAGKLSLSLYPLLLAAIVLRLGRRFGKEHPPWGALLFFPFAFNQQYFLGNLNYLLSLPLILLALLDFEDLVQSPRGRWPFIRQFLWQVALFLTHPLSFLVYISMAIAGGLLTQRRQPAFWRKLSATTGMAVLLFAASWVETKITSLPSTPGGEGIGWLPPWETLRVFGFMFGGMQSPSHAEPWTLALWGAIALVVAVALLLGWRAQDRPAFSRRHLLYLALALLGVLILPFQWGVFSYINLRIAALAYFLIALLVARIRFRGLLAACLVALLAACMVDSVRKQARISARVEEVLPLVSRIPPRARILPLHFEPGSQELDSVWFDPHVHDTNYYHLAVAGGGFTAYLLTSPIHPVHYREGQIRPAPPVFRPDLFRWKAHAADYQYFLVQGALEQVPPSIPEHCAKVATSRSWTLFERRLQ